MNENSAQALVTMQRTRSRWRPNYGRIAVFLATGVFWFGIWKLWRHVIAPTLAGILGN